MKRTRADAVLPGTTKRVKGDEDGASQDTPRLPIDFTSWERSPLPKGFSPSDDLIFQQMDIDYTMGDPIEGMPGSHVGKVPVIRMFGATAGGHSVCLLIHGVIPYFYVEAPPNFKESDCENFRLQLNRQMQKAPLQGIHVKYENYVLHAELITGKSIMGYSGEGDRTMIRISMAAPMLVPSARKLLEAGFVMWHDVPMNLLTYESNVLFVLRYMIDRDLVGADWVKCPSGDYALVPDDNRVSRCQIEAIIAFDRLVSLGFVGEWDKIAPLRTLSFDIECCADGGGFPDPNNANDRVIQIANYVAVQGQTEPLCKVIFNLNGCAPIVGAHVFCFDTEAALLNAWGRFVQMLDPDFIIGYNIANFDFWYVLTRAKLLGATDALHLSRILNDKCQIKTEVFSSKAYGRRETKTCSLVGRVQFDILQAVQRDYKLRSYTLNSVAAHFLGQQKEDVQYNIIGTLFKGTDNDRRRLAVYCLKDAQLPYLLMDKLMMMVNYLEMARVTGVPVSFLLSRGQQIKVFSQLFRKAKERNMFIPTLSVQATGEEVAYTGAVVIDPLTGYYDIPISTLDFNSLYPTIMIAHNLCYTTLVSPDDVKSLSPDQYFRTPNGDYFVKSSVREGILPEILKELLAARKKAKRAMATEKDPFKAAVQNGRQLALKVSANSVYGFTGAVRGKLPCLSVSASVTAYGREMIDRTKELVELKYTIANGYKHDAVVIYGDTDSVMVKFGTHDIAEAMELGKEAAEHVTKHFIKPINLEFEKAYFPYLLMSKKRYAGLLWTRPDKHDKMDAKGIVTVRRDNCPLVKEVIDTSLHKILIDRDPRGAEEYVKAMISDLLQNRVDLSLLVITKALSKNQYKAKQAHVELTNRMHKRDPGSAPNVGDRVPYVIIQGAKDARAYEKAEDPLYALENGIPLDVQYYLDHQLSNPLTSIFTPILGSVESLLKGDHTRKVVSNASGTNPLSGFLQRSVRCMNCRTIVKSDQVLCEHCKDLNIEAQIYQEKLESVNELELKFSRLWTQCQACQGSFHQPVLCTSRDCPIFYMRTQVSKDLQEAQNKLARFKIDW